MLLMGQFATSNSNSNIPVVATAIYQRLDGSSIRSNIRLPEELTEKWHMSVH
jgi:hypothetical protein